MTDDLRRLAEELEWLRDFGYQPMFNGRPSCPFCSNFVDDEQTHAGRCVLAAANPQRILALLDVVDAARDYRNFIESRPGCKSSQVVRDGLREALRILEAIQ